MRILAMSDLHGQLPPIGHQLIEDEGIDALIIAGDICPDFRGQLLVRHAAQSSWLVREFMPWFLDIPTEHKHFTWGNHDWLSEDDGGRHCLVDREAIMEGFRFWFSPWSQRFMQWSWMAHPETLDGYYANIPVGIDVLVSHQPPFAYGDNIVLGGEHLGSRELFTHMTRIRPQVLICGHIHGGRGSYRHRFEDGDDIRIVNVSSVDEQYRLHHEPYTIIQL